MATTERTRTGKGGTNMKGEVQTIGDRVVINPRTRLCFLRDAEGNVFDTFRLCPSKSAAAGTRSRGQGGYRGTDGWCCKRCGQLHTLDGTTATSAQADPARLRPNPSLVREFDRRTRVSLDWSAAEDLEASQ